MKDGVFLYEKKGVFINIDSMNALEEILKFSFYVFTRIVYCEFKYIVAWYKDEVELINKVLIPVSGKKRKISMK